MGKLKGPIQINRVGRRMESPTVNNHFVFSDNIEDWISSVSEEQKKRNEECKMKNDRRRKEQREANKGRCRLL